jgi:hypothetical protein
MVEPLNRRAVGYRSGVVIPPEEMLPQIGCPGAATA